MKKILLFFTLLFFTEFSVAQNAPPVEWAEAVSGTYGGNYTAIRTPNNLYVLRKSSNRFSGFADLIKYDGNTTVWTKSIKSCTTTTTLGGCNYPIYSFLGASQTNGVLIKKRDLSDIPFFEYYSSDGDLVWSKSDDVKEVSATLDGGFYVSVEKLVYEPPTTVAYSYIQRFAANGDLMFQINFDVSLSTPTVQKNIQTTSDNGLVVLLTTELRKYNLDGSLAYTKPIVADNIISIDNSTFGVYDNNSFKKISTSDGTVLWEYLMPNIKDVKVMLGNIFITDNNSTVKLNQNGEIVWNQTNYGGERIEVFENNSVAILKGNVVTKLNANGSFHWEKTFSNAYVYNYPQYTISMHKTNDEGICLVARYPNGNASDGHLMKIAPDNGSCNFTVGMDNGCIVGYTTFTAKFNNSTGVFPPYTKHVLADDFTYQWKKDGVNIVGANAISFQPTQDGSYSVVIQNGNCAIESTPFVRSTANLIGVISTNSNNSATLITSTQIIENPARVTYQTRKSILLQPGFEARTNSVFEAKIMGCN